MTEKIIVIPQEVRGLGNIVDEKELTDYDRHNSALTESTATVFGKSMTVYTMEATGYHLSLTLGGPSVVYGQGVYCFATLTDIEGDAVSDASIKFYVDDTLRDTQSTNSSGKAITTTGTNLAIGSHSIKAVYTTDDEDIIATATLTVTKRPTVLTINTPALVYSDEFDVTGTLKNSSDNEGIGNATVTLHWKVGDGPEQTATATTGQYGAVTFHRSAPTSVTDYTFWMTYDGTATRNGASTSEITVTVDKETSVLNVTSPTQNQQVTPGGTFDITGEITDNDGHYIPSVVLDFVYKQNNVVVGSDTYIIVSLSSGAFSKTVTNPFSMGTGTVEISYSGNSEYTGALETVSVNCAGGYDSIVVTADKNILSYADSEKATLYAQLKKNGSNHSQSGVTITFKQGSTTLGTAQTNSSGLATLTNGYESISAGDISITASDGTLVSETYSIIDASYYNGNTVRGELIRSDVTLPSNFKATFKVKRANGGTNTSTVHVGSDDSNHIMFGQIGSEGYIGIYIYKNGSNIDSVYQHNVLVANVETEITFTSNNGVHTITANGVTKTLTNSIITGRSYLELYSNNNYVKELLIKPL